MNKSAARKLVMAVSAGLAVTACTAGTHDPPRVVAMRGLVTIPMAMVGDPHLARGAGPVR